ncbi:MAG: pantetheine-phosphate adenylyltransferase [Campylobacteraceae bacterium 4484_166]|nr:MAG: pantetheine-phosphate adenylyltransferase [Campylobacteraceae bacterium 4484_166]
MKKAIYSGTFDPITNGHMDIINRALSIFDEVVVAIATNQTKKPMFDIDSRVKLASLAIKNKPNVKVVAFDCLLVDFASSLGISHIVRGLRAVSDFEYELQMGYANSSLSKTIQTIYFMPSLQNAFVSSSVVRQLIQYKGTIEHLVPKETTKDIFEIYYNRGS